VLVKPLNFEPPSGYELPPRGYDRGENTLHLPLKTVPASASLLTPRAIVSTISHNFSRDSNHAADAPYLYQGYGQVHS
jgi:hypothetical protein